MKRIILTLTCAFCSALSSACSDGSALQERAALVWTIDTAPTVVISSRGSEPLFNVQSIASSQARLAVAEGRDNVVSVYDLKGHLLHVFGGAGGGPGEFEGLFRVYFLPGDSVLAFDARLRRFQVFDRTGQYARGFTLRHHDGSPVQLATPVGILESSHIIVQQIRSDREDVGSPGVSRALIDILRFSTDGGMVDTVATVRGWEAYDTQVDGVVMGNTPIPFGHSTYVAAAGPQAVLAMSDSNMLQVYPSNRAPAKRIANAGTPGSAVTPSDIAAFKQRALESTPESMRWRLAVIYDEMPFPKQKAPFNSVHAGPDGTVWLGLPGETEAPKMYSVFARDGKPVGRVQLPLEFRPVEVSDDAVVGIWTDSLGTESVRRYAMSR